ncbi:MAG: hypothetical protein K2L95_00895 [Alphaproteobacteria bacterium]|nr:hypothetical protein [Alphaproteobacteria bacterium]
MKIVTLIENNPITGVVYGIVEIATPAIPNTHNKHAVRQYQQAQTKKAALMKQRAEKTKHK